MDVSMSENLIFVSCLLANWVLKDLSAWADTSECLRVSFEAAFDLCRYLQWLQTDSLLKQFQFKWRELMQHSIYEGQNIKNTANTHC